MNNPPIQTPIPTPIRPKNTLVIFLSVLSLVLLAATALFAYQTMQLRSRLAVLEASFTQLTPTPTPTIDSISNWKIYSSDFYRFSFQYPPTYSLTENTTGGGFQVILNQGAEDEISLGISPKDIANIKFFLDTESTSEKKFGNNTWSEFFLPNGYPDGGDKNPRPIYAVRTVQGDYIYTFRIFGSSLAQEQTTILSTFKFISTESLSVIKTTYTAPTNWTRVTSPTGLNLCLPPKWEFDSRGDLVFNRDPGYIPGITTFQTIPYSGGSTREAYFKFWEAEYPNVRELVSISDTNINGNHAITIYPTNNEQKTSPEGLAVSWYTAGKLWKTELSNWNMTNKSQTAFLNDFYTMISCSF